MAAQALPFIVRLFPVLVRTRLVRGKIIPLQTVRPETEAEMARKLARKLRVRQREGFNDNAHVVKVSDVATCLNDRLEPKKHGTLLTNIAVFVCRALITDDSTGGPMEKFTGDVIECVRDKALKQTTRRRRLTYRYSKRQI